MNDTTMSSPSRLLKFTAVAARWLLGLLVGAWLLLALSVVVLHVWIVPRIGDYRGALEAQATRAIGVPVRIGSIEARSGSFFPTVELRDVVLEDARRQEALRLARVVASVSPRSVWNLSFEQLYIEQPQVDVRRDAEGKLHIAGLEMSTQTSGGGDGADWFFAQREVVVQGGTVRWIDEGRKTEPLRLTDVQFVARNGSRKHQMRIDATPPAGWGQRFTLIGDFRQPLLSVRSGNWKTWDGQLFANLPYIDATRLGRYVNLDARIREGSGGLRLWADVVDGQLSGAVADLALMKVDASLGKDLQPLVLQGVTGRLAGHRDEGIFEFSTTNLQFETSDGMRWPGGNIWLQHAPAKGRAAERGAFRADRLDLGALALIADRLPIGDASRRLIDSYGLRGLVERIDGNWQGSPGAPDKYQVRGRISNFSIASQPGDKAEPAAEPARPAAVRNGQPAVEPPRPPVGTPGVRGATVEFDANQAGGNASAAIAKGAVDFPGVFEEPVVPIDSLQAQLQWKIDGPAVQLQVSGLRFSNADAEGEATASWRTTDPAVSRGGGRFPGVLDLQGRLSRADGTRVHRYLPLEIPKATRDYVRDAVTKGSASSVDFRVRGDLYDMPFMDPKHGDFRIAARVADVTYAYVPPTHGPVAWPALTALSGELVFERAGMLVHNARGRIAGVPGVEVTKAEAQIADMSHHAALLKVDAQAKGSLGDMLKAGAPLTGPAESTLAAMRASGNADYKLRLELPLATMDKSKVQASIALQDNELQLAPTAPSLTQARGTLNFTEAGFSLAGVQARAAGGAVRIEGSGRFGASTEMSFRAQGTATAEGLRATREVDWLARLAKNASGGTAYSANLSVRDGTPEFLVTSNLQGLGLQLPHPLTKAPDESMPLRVEKKVVSRENRSGAAKPVVIDQISAELGRAASASYVRDVSGDDARVLRGGIGVGLAAGESAAPPERGVFANLRFERLDIAAWQALFGEATGSPGGGRAASDAGGDAVDDFLPTLIALRAQELAFGGRTLHNVVLGGTRDGPLWRANIDATELSGYAEYRHTQAGRLYARLARLKIARSEATAVESLLDEQPSTLPALDIVVDDFELFGHRLGRAEIDAVNRGGAGREWRLNRLAMINPDASFSAQGSWAAAPGATSTGRDARRTSMDFKLDIADAGALLGRFGMKDVVRRGRGRLEGDVNWNGAPFSLDSPSLAGQLQINVESGQFLKADPGIAKLLGVLSLQALPRRLTLDFRDVFSEGFAFDFLRGDVKIDQGVASTNNLQMKGVNAAVLMDGSADFARETQSLRVVVVPEINAGTAALVATAINPAIGLGTFLAQMVLSRPLVAAATQEFKIDGTWTDPKITRVPRRLASEAAGAPATPAPR
ncbi:TIGR02099 family protein [Variovorax sp. HW608]|uniref:YhdP family protein n=1 Tax=Variovorax sp. HW608 TaxID=1034889 RepID=UPI00081FF6B5|nr:YhdP family protein [Variovorax sp. HW608]SCK61964.1 TIGR02099 family protein [Variovorax sp. HW608]